MLVVVIQSDAAPLQQQRGVADPVVIVDIANEIGFMISTEAITKAQEEISDDELVGAAGTDLVVVNRDFGSVNRNSFLCQVIGTVGDVGVRELMPSSRSYGD